MLMRKAAGRVATSASPAQGAAREEPLRALGCNKSTTIFHQGLVLKKELPTQTELTKALCSSLKAKMDKYINLEAVKRRYCLELTFFIFMFPQSSSCM